MFSLYCAGTIVTVFGFFALMELATRVISLTRGDGFSMALHELDAADERISDIYQFHPFQGFMFAPNNEIFAGHPRQESVAKNRTDKLGFLSGPVSLSPTKSPNEIRIATIGASTTANISLNYEENWPGRLGRLVQQKLPNKKITVINAGVPGFNTAQSIGNLALRVMPLKPDLVIIYHAYNDLKIIRPNLVLASDYRNIHKLPYGFHEKPNWIIRFANASMFYVRTRNAYREYKTATAEIELMQGENRINHVPKDAAEIFERNIRTLVAIAKSGGAQVLVSSFTNLHELDAQQLAANMTTVKQHELFSLLHFTPGLSLQGIFSGLTQYNTILQKIADDEATGWVDNAKLIEKSDENFLDRVHFTALGAKRMADNMLPPVLGLVAPAELDRISP